MCTLTIVHSTDGLIFTSNRDEQRSRPESLMPQWIEYNHADLYFARDPQAGGTWCAVRKDGVVGVLLNGAFKRHAFGGVYKKSRGLVLLDLLSAVDISAHWEIVDLSGIEPFHILCRYDGKLVRWLWDGVQKFEEPCDPAQPQLFASVTLYSAEEIDRRTQAFRRALHNGSMTADELFAFHGRFYPNEKGESMILERDEVCTKSVTQIILHHENVRFRHNMRLTGATSDFSFSVYPKA